MKRLSLIITIILTIGLAPLWLSLCGLINWDFSCDFTNQQVAYIYEFKRMLSSGHPWWSWNTYLGDNFISAYSYYGLFSPFSWFCCLFPYKFINLGILISVYFKTIFTGLFSTLYFRRMKISDNSAVIGGLLYTFSSFYIINLYYGMFCEAIMLYPLLLIALEDTLDHRKYAFPILSLITFAIVTIQYYCAVASLICVVIYLICRVIFDDTYRSFRNCFSSIFAITYGIVMSAIVLIPTALHLMGGNRGYLEPLGNIWSIFSWAYYHIFWAIIPKISEDFTPSFVYGTFNNTSLFIQLSGISLSISYVIKKRTWLTGCLIIYAIIYLTPLNGIFTLFTSLSYCRWIYAFILMIILATVKCIDNKSISQRFINNYILFSILYAIIGIVGSIVFFGYNAALNERSIIEIILALINFVALYRMTRDNKRIIYIISILSTLNLLAFTYLISTLPLSKATDSNYAYILNVDSTNKKEIYTPRTDYVKPIYQNLSLLEGKPTTAFFHSLFNKNIVDFTAYARKERIVVATCQPIKTPRESRAALLSIKNVEKYDSSIFEDLDYTYGLMPTGKRMNGDVYSFDYYIPIGMVYESYVTRSQLDSLRSADENADLCLMMLDNIVIEDKEVPEVLNSLPSLKKGNIDTSVTLDSVTQIRHRHTVDFHGDSKGYTFTTHPDTPAGMVFISTPADEGFKIKIDGRTAPLYHVNMGMSGILLPTPGVHHVEASYLAPGLKLGAIISATMMIMLLIFTASLRRRGSRSCA